LAWWLRPAKEAPLDPIAPLPPPVEQRTEKQTERVQTNASAASEPDKNGEWTNHVPAEQRAAMIQRVQKLSQIASAANVPIPFYGKLTDQFNQPIEGVRVEAAVSSWRIVGLATHQSSQKTNYFVSRSDGRFEVKGIKGCTMTIGLEKQGYELAPRSPMGFGFGYGPADHYEPDPAKPVGYRMWKRQGGVELTSQGFEKRVRADGTPISLDVSSGQFVIGATTLPGPTVRVWREPFFYDPQTSLPEAWRYELIWPKGRVQFTEDTFCYLAPESGYQDKTEVNIIKGEPNFRFRDKRSFYFINQASQFGRGELEIYADYTEEKVLVIFSICWNPDGTRNLEPKPQ
jgi:hypothetical protein